MGRVDSSKLMGIQELGEMAAWWQGHTWPGCQLGALLWRECAMQPVRMACSEICEDKDELAEIALVTETHRWWVLSPGWVSGGLATSTPTGNAGSVGPL